MKNGLLKKFVLITSIVTLSCGAFAACGSKSSGKSSAGGGDLSSFNKTGYPIVKDKITLKAVTSVSPLNGDFNEMKMLKDINEKTNIKVEYEGIPTNVWEEKKNLILASGKLPDIFFGGGLSDSDIVKYGKQGMLIPLEKLIDDYAPNVKKLLDKNPDLKKSLTSPDGHIYTLPYFDEFLPENIPDNLFINKTWLDKLGLKVPTTTDEYYEVLKAFKTKDPNDNGAADEIPLSFRANQTYFGEWSMFGAFGTLDNKEHVMIKDNKIVFSPMEEGYKEGINWFNKLYKEGLIDKEVFTQDQSQYTAKGKGKEAIVGSFIIYADENYVGKDRAYKDYISLKPLKGPKGHQLWNRYNMSMYLDKFAITNMNKHPEATMRWADELFTENLSLQVHWGELDKNLKAEGDKFVIQTPPEGVSIDEFRFKNAPGPFAPGVMSKEMYEKLVFAKDKQRKIERYNLYDTFATKDPLPKIRFTEAQLGELSTLNTDIDNYVKQMKAKWITGERNVNEDWDKYLDQLKKMNVEQYIKIYQDGFEKYK